MIRCNYTPNYLNSYPQPTMSYITGDYPNPYGSNYCDYPMNQYQNPYGFYQNPQYAPQPINIEIHIQKTI